MVIAQLIQGFSQIGDQFYPGHSWPVTVDEAVERWGNVMQQYYGTMVLPVAGGGVGLTAAIQAFKLQMKGMIESHTLRFDPLFNTLHQNMALSVNASPPTWTTIPQTMSLDNLLLQPDGYEGTSAQVIAAIAAEIDTKVHLTTSTMIPLPMTTFSWV